MNVLVVFILIILAIYAYEEDSGSSEEPSAKLFVYKVFISCKIDFNHRELLTQLITVDPHEPCY